MFPTVLVTYSSILTPFQILISLASLTTPLNSRLPQVSRKLFLLIPACLLVLYYLLSPSSRSSPPIMPPVVFEAIGKHSATIIFAHGLGDTAAGWVPLAQSLRSRYKHIKWVLPTAPTQPVSINMGMKMTSWFDIQVNYFESIIEFTGLMLFRCWIHSPYLPLNFERTTIKACWNQYERSTASLHKRRMLDSLQIEYASLFLSLFRASRTDLIFCRF